MFLIFLLAARSLTDRNPFFTDECINISTAVIRLRIHFAKYFVSAYDISLRRAPYGLLLRAIMVIPMERFGRISLFSKLCLCNMD